MSRTYKTESGIYNESDLVVAVWVNPKHASSNQARYLETMTSENSRYPLAFPKKDLKEHPAWSHCPVATCTEDIDKYLIEPLDNVLASRERPLLIPLPLATQYMGWDSFYIPTEYTKKSL